MTGLDWSLVGGKQDAVGSAFCMVARKDVGAALRWPWKESLQFQN